MSADKLGDTKQDGSPSTDDVTQAAMELARWKIASQILKNVV